MYRINDDEANTITRIAKDYGVEYLAIFGSEARGTATIASDIDIIARFSSTKSLFELEKIEIEMSDATGRRIDLVTEASLSPYIRDEIQKEMRILYEQRS